MYSIQTHSQKKKKKTNVHKKNSRTHTYTHTPTLKIQKKKKKRNLFVQLTSTIKSVLSFFVVWCLFCIFDQFFN